MIPNLESFYFDVHVHVAFYMGEKRENSRLFLSATEQLTKTLE